MPLLPGGLKKTITEDMQKMLFKVSGLWWRFRMETGRDPCQDDDDDDDDDDSVFSWDKFGGAKIHA